MTVKSFNPDNILIDDGEIFVAPIGVPAVTFTPLASPAPTTLSFAVNSTDAALIDNLRHLVQIAGVTIAYTCTEAAAMPRIGTVAPHATIAGAWVVSMAVPFVTAPTATAGNVVQVWRCLGAIDGDNPISIVTDISTQKFKIQQTVDAIASRQTDRSITINAPLAEMTFQSLALAYGVPAPAAGATGLRIGGINSTPRRDRVLIIGPGTEAARRFYLYYSCTNSGSANQSLGRSNMQVINLEFEVQAAVLNGELVTADIFDFA